MHHDNTKRNRGIEVSVVMTAQQAIGNHCTSTLGCQRSERHEGQAGQLYHHPPLGHCLYHCRSQTNPCRQTSWMSEEHIFNSLANIRFQERNLPSADAPTDCLGSFVIRASQMKAVFTEGKHAKSSLSA